MNDFDYLCTPGEASQGWGEERGAILEDSLSSRIARLGQVRLQVIEAAEGAGCLAAAQQSLARTLELWRHAERTIVRQQLVIAELERTLAAHTDELEQRAVPDLT